MNAFLKGAAATAFAIILSSAAIAEEINFGIISTESQQNLKPKWEPLLADLSKATGLEVKPFFASDYSGVIEGMRFGKVQLAWYGNKSAMEAVDRAGGEVFVQSVDVGGNPGYWSVILAPKDSKLNSVEDLLKCDKSLNFGLGDPNSTSGFLVPTTFIFAANNVDPKDCFKNVTNANHEINAMSVANSQLDAATNNTENMTVIEKNAPDAFAKLKVIWKSPLIPSDPLVWRKDLPEETKAKLREFFVTYGTDKSKGDIAHEKEVLAGLEWAPFRPSTDDQLLPIRIMELTKNIAKIQGDASLPEAEKKAQIEKLEADKVRFEEKLKSTQG
ncbi:phosphonate ABC transporter substrate-binding protein [Phyllobacterium phragmitis]|uniref:Phosphonate ABC transporter substrate-binding protein n=1 Tax=Phyllobacterium phragmitis TaxID=2670329 RepID=A0A2S9IWL0_9HYPH|nr:phosphonate ABC transporter substrate-binding protein [Phyllobacterium phragmitis]PRD44912.1 phosphonate ABC transporter substrate-binding protein [Phyllobacterium phragmitis]